ncbi:dihydrofolate reductase [Nonomuraea muscovyensis]|uniref:Dihydrofolate reductase n=1 Tax=Nonomuraea muscovyensis TaxID=1124761 RepID=A0A7X0C3T6_9ACTN|nr:dihydrofolate reductase family protein [Nonomuraea muscovyensis]MBB6347998.1 dihydrofolate reductase [Nonomuraea muscovyensis]
MRKLIAGLKISLDGKVEGPEGYADWVPAWSEDYGLTQQVDAVVLGGGMYPGYEQYWTALKAQPDQPHPLTGKTPAQGEIEWSDFAAQTPHYVLSTSLRSAAWPQTRFLRKSDEVAELKEQPGKDIYLMGGARVTASLIDAGLVDELRLIVYPLIAGDTKALFGTAQRRHALELRDVRQLPDGLVKVVYALT